MKKKNYLPPTASAAEIQPCRTLLTASPQNGMFENYFFEDLNTE